MKNIPFDPLNDLEQLFQQAQEGEIPVEAFMDSLLASQVFVLIDKDLGDSGEWDPAATPMTLSNAAGVPLLAMFTAAERAVEWPQHYPQFAYGVFADFLWLLELIAPEVGLVINPGCSVGLEMPPETVAQLRADAVNPGVKH